MKNGLGSWCLIGSGGGGFGGGNGCGSWWLFVVLWVGNFVGIFGFVMC